MKTNGKHETSPSGLRQARRDDKIAALFVNQLPYKMYARSDVDLLIAQAVEKERRIKFRLVGWVDLDGDFLRQVEMPTQPGTWTALYEDRSL